MMGSLKTVPPRIFRIWSQLSTEDINEEGTYSTVRTSPHFLKLEFLNSGLVWGDGCTFDTDRVFLDGIGRIDSDLVVGL